MADAAAFHAIYDATSSSGLLPCIGSKNAVLESSAIAVDGHLQSLRCSEYYKFVKAGFHASDILHTVATKAKNKTVLELAEKIYGMGVNFDGAFQGQELRVHLKPATGSRYDLMHTLYSNGAVQLVQMLMKCLTIEMGVTFNDLQTVFLGDWRFPKAHAHVMRYSRNAMFSGKKISEDGYPRMSASQCKACLLLLRYLGEGEGAVIEKSDFCTAAVSLSLASFYALARAAGVVAAKNKRSPTQGSTVKAAMEEYVAAHGRADPDSSKPKLH